MTPRVVPMLRRSSRPASSYQAWRQDGELADIEHRAFWRWATLGALDGQAQEAIPADEYRVLSKGASGGGFLVPTDLAAQVTSAARAASSVAQVATEFLTATGDTFNVSLAATHGTAVWLAESGGYTPSDETVTQQAMGAFKAASKIIVSEELLMDEAVDLPGYLSVEMGGRIGALQENAFCQGDGSGKPLGLVGASSGITSVAAATGSATSYKPADLAAVFKALPSGYRKTASWLINADDFVSLAALTDTAGALALPSLSFDPPSLFGRPVSIGDLPAPAANAKSLVVGDFKIGYGIRRVQQVLVQRQDELHADAGQVGFKAFARVDGRVLIADALRILAHSAT